MKTPEAAPHPPKEPSAVSTDDGTPLPDGWQRFPSRSRPGESAYRNMLTGERRRHPPTEPAAVSTDDGPPLPDGWKRFASRSRPGETVYRNMITGQRVRHRPAQPASAAYEPPGPIITQQPGSEHCSCCERLERGGEAHRLAPPCLDKCPPCLKQTTHWCLLFWFNKQTSVFWIKILMFEVLEWVLLVLNIFVRGSQQQWAMGLAGTALAIDVLKLPILYEIWAVPDEPQAHGLKFLAFALEHLTDVMSIAALFLTVRDDGKSDRCLREDAWFQWNVVFIVFRLYILCTRTALEELVETCTSWPRTQFRLKLVCALGLIATGVLSGMVAISIDVGTCENHQRGIFGVGHKTVFRSSDRGQLILAYLVTLAFIGLFILALVVGRICIEKCGGHDMEGHAWSTLNPCHEKHNNALKAFSGLLTPKSSSHVVPAFPEDRGSPATPPGRGGVAAESC